MAEGTDENSRLLSDRQSAGTEWMRGPNGFFLICLILICLSGIFAGTYLLLTEGKEEIVDDDWHRIVPGCEWKAHVGNSSFQALKKKLKLPVRKVLFLETDTENCFGDSRCFQLLRQLQLKHVRQLNQSDISYNFVVTGDGVMYEGRGWNYQSEVSKNAVVVAFTGNSYGAVTLRQKDSAKLFLESGVVLGKVVPCYKVYSREASLYATVNFISEFVAHECKSSGNS